MMRAKHTMWGVLVLALWLGSVSTLLGAGEQQSLCINLTSNELNRAAMAVNFAHHARQKTNTPATVFLNVDGVRLMNRHIPQSSHVGGQTINEMQ